MKFVLPIVACLLFVSLGFAQVATIHTDKDDYEPGDHVVITGGGWQPGQPVQLLIELFSNPSGSAQLTAVADGNGDIVNDEYLILQEHLGEQFTLTATGIDVNGDPATAQTMFTDAVTLQAASMTVNNCNVVTVSATFRVTSTGAPISVSRACVRLQTGSCNEASSTDLGFFEMTGSLITGTVAGATGTYTYTFTGNCNTLYCVNAFRAGSGGTSCPPTTTSAALRNILPSATTSCPPTLGAVKFYDANANGINDDGLPIQYWPMDLSGDASASASTNASGVASFGSLAAGSYTVTEGTPSQSNWVATTATSQNVTLACGDQTTVSFGNLCLGGGGGLTIGFWSNKNGQALITPGDLAALSVLNLKQNANANCGGKAYNYNVIGIDFNPANGPGYKSWVLGANATNMTYMLSAQLSAMKLNVLHSFVSGSALVYAPGCGNTGVGNNFITIDDLIAAANTELGIRPTNIKVADNKYSLTGCTFITDGSYYDYATCLKNALDKANNNLNFVQSAPCSFGFDKTQSDASGNGTLTGIPSEFVLAQNYPNPFNPSTTIGYGVPEQSIVRLVVYDILGREVGTLVNGIVDAGYHSVVWNTNGDAKSLASGVYIYRLTAVSVATGKEHTQFSKMLLTK